jgi:error-prone DNA polymerase
MLEVVVDGRGRSFFCNNCAHEWHPAPERFRSIDELVSRSGINREELSVLAEIGALNSFGYTRREALWQVERAVRPAAAFDEGEVEQGDGPSPLPEMSGVERTVADYAGTGLTIGPHPMALRREEMRLRGALRAADLARQRDGRRVRVAGAVITRQRPGTAKGFVFLTLEDETGTANAVLTPRVFERFRVPLHTSSVVEVAGPVQNVEGVIHVRVRSLEPVGLPEALPASHDYR